MRICPGVKNLAHRRINETELWENKFLVSLDVETGKKQWERPLNTTLVGESSIPFWVPTAILHTPRCVPINRLMKEGFLRATK